MEHQLSKIEKDAVNFRASCSCGVWVIEGSLENKNIDEIIKESFGFHLDKVKEEKEKDAAEIDSTSKNKKKKQ